MKRVEFPGSSTEKTNIQAKEVYIAFVASVFNGFTGSKLEREYPSSRGL